MISSQHFCNTIHHLETFQGLKDLADTELLNEAANTELGKNNLEQAQTMFTDLLKKYDSIIAPPYPVSRLCNILIKGIFNERF